jgi:hypothetical protein
MTPWVRELSTPGGDAVVVPVEVRALAHAIDRVLGDRTYAAERVRRLAETHRDRRVKLDRLADVYRRLGS